MSLKLISLDEWLSFFDSPMISYAQFVKQATVYTVEGIIPLMSFSHSSYGKLSQTQLQLLYNKIVIHKHKYLTNVYKASLSVRDRKPMSELPLNINNNRNIQYKSLVRNLYYKDILLQTQYHQNIRSYLEVIIDLYRDFIIDRKLLAPSVLRVISDSTNGLSQILCGIYFRASIMNPFLVYSLSVLSLHNPQRVLTPCLGWSSYLLGFMENPNLQQYVGIDVIQKVCKTTRQLAKIYRPDIECDIYCQPSEDLAIDRPFMERYANNFDTVFFCPPYYKLELYQGEEQSTERYTTYQEWLDRYWLPTVRLCYGCLRSGGLMCYIISGYRTSSKKYIDLDSDMNQVILDNHFIPISNYPMSKSIRFGRNNRFIETIYIFQK